LGFLHRHLRTTIACAAALAIVVPLGWLWWSSLLPSSYDLATMGYVDLGGGPAGMEMPGMDDGTPVADLTADATGQPDVRYSFTVRQDGKAFTVNGQSPGPLLKATVGDLVEVHLTNDNVTEGVTLHWHGVDVPNAEDGVAGVTQDAVLPGETFTYRWVATRPGTYWYHSHQVSHTQVAGGLLGPILIEQRHPDPGVIDEVVVLHDYGQGTSINGTVGVTTLPATPGQRVRVRLIDTDSGGATAWVTGAPFEVAAIDGTDVHGPTPLTDRVVEIPAGGRVDLLVTVPAGGVRIDASGASTLVLGRDPSAGALPATPEQTLDPLSYGTPAPIGFDPGHPDRTFDYRIGRRPGFLDGKPGLWWTINGHLFPHVPMYTVAEGDVVRFHLENNTGVVHPMHLHGHHAVVLDRDGVAATGSPWWVDSLDIRPDESYDIAFVADNPGIWMDHCHNLAHPAQGLVAHLMYEGVTSSFRVGGVADNQPE
jgi:FtsP/CotA-like multicopper oxidase with cupredoxin domain